MNLKDLGLVLFAVIALGAVFAFLIVIGPPTGEYASGVGTSTFKMRDAFEACARGADCPRRMKPYPIGIDDLTQTVWCECPVPAGAYVDRHQFVFRRSLYQWG